MIEKNDTGFEATISFFRASCKGKVHPTPLLAAFDAISKFGEVFDDTPFPYHEIRITALQFLR